MLPVFPVVLFLPNTDNVYWLKVAQKRGFAIDQMTIVPDHGRLLTQNYAEDEHRRVRYGVDACRRVSLHKGFRGKLEEVA